MKTNLTKLTITSISMTQDQHVSNLQQIAGVTLYRKIVCSEIQMKRQATDTNAETIEVQELQVMYHIWNPVYLDQIRPIRTKK